MKTEMDGCENRFCLYWQENRCQLSYITLDAPGLCENCVYLEFPEKFLRMVVENTWFGEKEGHNAHRLPTAGGEPVLLFCKAFQQCLGAADAIHGGGGDAAGVARPLAAGE